MKQLLVIIFLIIIFNISCTYPESKIIKDAQPKIKIETKKFINHGLNPESSLRVERLHTEERIAHLTYIHKYKISEGRNKGDVWLCGVPINILERDSFDCVSRSIYLELQLPDLADHGNKLDRKVQSCNFLHPYSKEIKYIPVCIKAPMSINTESEKSLLK